MKLEADNCRGLILDSQTEYAAILRLLRTAYPAVPPGGRIGGPGYLDGILDGEVYGVRAAVNEFAREHGLVIRVTLDKIQNWFTFKPTGEIRPKPRIAVLTAYDSKQQSLAAISSLNKRQYCELHGYDFVEEDTSSATGRHPVWAKIPLIRKYLDRYDWVFWTDVDSLIMDMQVPLERFCDPSADMLICHEDLGVGIYNVNAGQMLFRSSDWSKQFLDEVWRQEWALKDAHQEQRAIIHLIWSRDVSDHIHIVAQKTFNSYLCNFQRGEFLLHFPDMPNDKRRDLMRYWAQFVTP